ncbi:hypothetical protein ACS0TY_029658 [Phlomoides rotata]
MRGYPLPCWYSIISTRGSIQNQWELNALIRLNFHEDGRSPGSVLGHSCVKRDIIWE